MKLDIGGGHTPLADHINIDPIHGEGPYKVAMPARLPFDDRSVSAIHASHVMEHIPAGSPRLDTFNELWRVLEDYGTLTVIVPAAIDWRAYADPTHVSFWLPESFEYFDGSIAAQADYGILLWETLDLTYNDGWEIHWTGRPRRD